ncbi:MAG: ATP phosphoribosyltransferase regulatory subunit, partial [Tagaea sp.]|nr:ATP phosphoribosyltransferase regulatory subunit [Tagaea sp.]
GVTLFTDTVLRAIPFPTARRRIFVPLEAPKGTAEALRAKGEVAIRGFSPSAEPKRLGCTHVWRAGRVEPIEG